MRNYEIPFRPIYEGYAAAAWGCGAAFMAAMAKAGSLPGAPFYLMGGASAGMGLWRGLEAYRRFQEKRNLKKGDLQFVSWKKYLDKANKNEGVWLGEGFPWGQQEVERASEVLKRDPERLLGSDALKTGHQWIHGLGAEGQKNIYFPQSLATGHTLLVGTTGSGKTRLYDLLVLQAILRGESVIVIDPKNDHDLRENCRRACEMMGEPERFVYFHPGMPEESARIDPLANWNRPTEIASRIATLIPSETGADPFTAFSWMALNNIVNGHLAIEEQPTLVKLRRYIEGDPGPLVAKALRTYFEKNVKDWESRVDVYRKKLRGKTDAEVYITMYQSEVVNESPNSEMEGLISAFTHNRDHYMKMTASLLPVLTMLTSGTLGPLLSPEANEHDERITTDSARIINNGQVAYIALDSLSDTTVGSAIGSILLADLTAVAGDRYNFGVSNTRVNIFIDEASEVVNVPTLQMLNKSRGCNFALTLATQTLADFETRMGSESKARQLLGNLNNMIVLRVLDGKTQEYIAENMPKTYVRNLEAQYRSGSSSTDSSEFNAMYGEGVKEEEVELFPPSLLGMLPNLHYLAKFANGKIVKGRLPILQMGEGKSTTHG